MASLPVDHRLLAGLRPPRTLPSETSGAANGRRFRKHGTTGVRLRVPFRGFLLPVLFLLWGAMRTGTGLSAANLWPNSGLEVDSNSDGIPNFWHRGGTRPSMAIWTPVLSVSPTHSLHLSDTSTNDYAEWYSDTLNITGGANYQLGYSLRYVTTNRGAMRVSVNYYDAADRLVSVVDFQFSGTHDDWEKWSQPIATPPNAARLRLTFTSGGGLDVTGMAWLDDITLTTLTNGSLVPYIENFPAVPSPLIIRDWKQTALDYHRLAFDPDRTGPFLPLLHQYTLTTAAGYSGRTFGLPSYVGNPHDGGEAVTALGAVLGGTLAGLNMASLNGMDRVHAGEVFYSVVNGHGLVLNNIQSQGAGSAWYDLFPSALFYQIGTRYPGRTSYQIKMKAIADSWLAALPILSNNWEHTGFSFVTMRPVDQAWHEPDMAIGIAWLEYMAYLQFHNPRYLEAADLCMSQMDHRSLNPFYEVLGHFGPVLAARMNAELGRNYSVEKHLNWIFAPTSDARPGWGCENGRWGAFDAHGLMGSTTDSGGYTFSMNSYVAAGLIAPLARYQPRFARWIGRWLLHVAANASLFYPATLPAAMQSSAAWVQQTGIQSISYEGVRHHGATTPYAAGDAAAPVQNLNPYGAWGSGYLAALVQTSNVPEILQIDCLATDTLSPPAFPSFLFYNPNPGSREVTVNAGPGERHLYDAVTGSFLATRATGAIRFPIEADSAVLLVQCPASGVVSSAGQKLMVDGVIIDGFNATLDRDADGLPDWWESLYFGNRTNAVAGAPAANQLSNLQCYWLGLNPLRPGSTFRATASLHPTTHQPRLTWTSVGGKTYGIEYSRQLHPPVFMPLATWTETNVAAGVETVSTWLDDGTITGGSPGDGDGYYRVRWLGP